MVRGEAIDRFAGHMAHRQRGPATGITIELGQHHPGQGQGLVERTRGIDGILTQHGVNHEQGFDGVQRGMQSLDLGHHLFVDGQPTGGIH